MWAHIHTFSRYLLSTMGGQVILYLRVSTTGRCRLGSVLSIIFFSTITFIEHERSLYGATIRE